VRLLSYPLIEVHVLGWPRARDHEVPRMNEDVSRRFS
jgi:hypothetical protein